MVLALRWVFCTDIRTDSDFCFIHRLISFYNRGGKCLLRGTDWSLIYSRLRFVFKRLILRTTEGSPLLHPVWGASDSSKDYRTPTPTPPRSTGNHKFHITMIQQKSVQSAILNHFWSTDRTTARRCPSPPPSVFSIHHKQQSIRLTPLKPSGDFIYHHI